LIRKKNQSPLLVKSKLGLYYFSEFKIRKTKHDVENQLNLNLCLLILTPNKSNITSIPINEAIKGECRQSIYIYIYILFFGFEETLFSKSVFYGLRWASKTPAILDSYKRCTFWLEFKTCCADLKPFIITSRRLGTIYIYILYL